MAAHWRQMTANDIETLLRIADQVHPELPENDAVFRERLRLFPQGCLSLIVDGEMGGYILSHPIQRDQPPALDSLLGDIDPKSDQYYIHDVAVLERFRGRGLAADGVRTLLALAEGYSTTCLVSVYGTPPFWSRFSFDMVQPNEAMAQKLSAYGSDAVYMIRQNAQ